MFKDLLSNQWIQGGFVFFVVVLSGSQLYSWHVRRTTPTIHKTVAPQEGKAQETNPSPPTAETETQPSCCESGDAACCQTPGSPCCPPANASDLTSEQSDQSATLLSTDTSKVDSTESESLLLSEGKVVPDHIVQEADRFREWDEKQEAHHKTWAVHNEKEAQLHDDFQRQYAALLMTFPIEERKATFDQIKRQMEPVSQELWDTYATKLYNFGLDFQTEYSPEEAEARSQQITARMAELSKQLVGSSKEGQKFLRTSKELMEESDDF